MKKLLIDGLMHLIENTRRVGNTTLALKAVKSEPSYFIVGNLGMFHDDPTLKGKLVPVGNAERIARGNTKPFLIDHHALQMALSEAQSEIVKGREALQENQSLKLEVSKLRESLINAHNNSASLTTENELLRIRLKVLEEKDYDDF